MRAWGHRRREETGELGAAAAEAAGTVMEVPEQEGRVKTVMEEVLALASGLLVLLGWKSARRKMLAWGGLAGGIWRKEWAPGKLWPAWVYPVVHHIRSPLLYTSHTPWAKSEISGC